VNEILKFKITFIFEYLLKYNLYYCEVKANFYYWCFLKKCIFRVKVLTWKRIMIRHREDVPLENGSMEERTDSLRKFTGFHEAIFDPHGTRGNHMDLGLSVPLMTKDVLISFKCSLGLR